MLSSYFTRYQDDYMQHAARANVRWDLSAADLHHRLRIGIDRYTQQFLFTGIQNIGATSIGIASPDFSLVKAIGEPIATRRYNDERIEEQGLWVASQLGFGEALELTGSLRKQRYSIASDRTGRGRAGVGSAADQTWSISAATNWSSDRRAWATSSSGMEPNRGLNRAGGFLPPQGSQLVEFGYRLGAKAEHFTVVAWRTKLSGLAMLDPQDRQSLVAAGSRRVEGLEAEMASESGPWSISTSLSANRSRQLVRTSNNLGDRFVGVPRYLGSLRLGYAPGIPSGPGSVKFFAAAQGMTDRMADDQNSLTLPGHIRMDVGAQWLIGSTRLQVGIRNLFDKRYVEAITAPDNVYQGARRSLWVDAAISWP